MCLIVIRFILFNICLISYLYAQLPLQIQAEKPVICAGSSVRLQAFGADSYLWQHNSGTLSTLEGASVIARPLRTTTYTVVGTGKAGCTGTAQVQVVVSEAKIKILASKYPLCPGEPLTLTAVGGKNYRWQANPALSTDKGAEVIARPKEKTIFRVSGEVDGCTATGEIEISVLAKPKLSLTFTRPAEGKTDGAINASASGGSPPYLYSLNSGIFQNNGGFSNLGEGLYTVVVKSGNGCTDTSMIRLESIKPCPDVTIVPLGALSFCDGDSVKLTAKTPRSVRAYQWMRDGLALPGATDSVFTAKRAGNYTVSIEIDECPKTSSESSRVILWQKPDFSTNVQGSEGLNGSIEVKPTSGKAPYTYRLNKGSFQANTRFEGLKPGNYEITLRDDNGCEQTKIVTVPEKKPCTRFVDLSYTGRLQFCEGDSVLLKATADGTGLSYQWQRNKQDLPEANGSQFYAHLPGEYQVIVQSKDCEPIISDFILVQVWEIPGFGVTIRNSIAGKNGGKIEVSPRKGKKPYLFSLDGDIPQKENFFDSLRAGEYQITVQDSNGCKSSRQVIVEEEPNGLGEESSSVIQLDVFPNPAENQLEISISLSQPTGFVVEIFDVSGKRLLFTRHPIFEKRVRQTTDISGLSSGIYVLSIRTAENTISRRFVKL